ncbi:ABC transporter ATP-binding protein [Weissella soli]|uniref:ABC transporter ATP-binding protein n=1 Tax=Weissella soli TaxID=155866 RepID=UPI0035A0CF39
MVEPSEIKAALKNSDTTLMEMLRFVFSSVLKRRYLLILNVSLLLMVAGLNFIIPQFTKNIIDQAIGQRSVNELISQVVWLIVTTIALGVVNFVSTYLMQRLSQESITEIRLQTYYRILQQDYAYFQNTKTGDLMVRLTGDINSLQNLISSDTFGIVGNLFTFIAVLGFLYAQNWELALAISLTFPVLFVIIRFFRSRIREAFSKLRATSSRISNQLQATLTEIELIKSFTTEQQETANFEVIVAESNRYQLEATRLQAIFNPLVTLVNTIGVAIALGVGGYFVIQQQMTVGDLVAYLSYLTLLQDPIRSFSRLLNVFQTAQVSYDRIKEIMAYEPAIIDAPHPVAFPSPLRRGTQLTDVTFHYDMGNVDTLENINMMIPIGQTTALVGRSGAGKSTLVRLLTRLYERSGGKIMFDDVAIEHISMKSLRQHISFVSQEVTIIDGTISENIAYGTPGATEAAIWNAAEQANISEFIRGLPNQMATQVGERGVKLSGGQKQRLSIARAFLKDAPIVILDEATAALDNESERAIQHALNELMRHKTAIVIAHRLSTVHNAEQIIVIDQGSVVERGTHDELIAQAGVYKTLYDAQFE